jgi:hypothetical protein
VKEDQDIVLDGPVLSLQPPAPGGIPSHCLLPTPAPAATACAAIQRSSFPIVSPFASVTVGRYLGKQSRDRGGPKDRNLTGSGLVQAILLLVLFPELGPPGDFNFQIMDQICPR